jgi:hypothetical protein
MTTKHTTGRACGKSYQALGHAQDKPTSNIVQHNAITTKMPPNTAVGTTKDGKLWVDAHEACSPQPGPKCLLDCGTSRSCTCATCLAPDRNTLWVAAGQQRQLGIILEYDGQQSRDSTRRDDDGGVCFPVFTQGLAGGV